MGLAEGTILLLKGQFKLTIEEIQHALEQRRYICDRSLATVVYLSMVMGKPVLLEGEAGVGKTEVAKVLADVLNTTLIRLQCYEGLDSNTALYEWNYPKQILRIKQYEVQRGSGEMAEPQIFTEEYLIRRPLLEAIQRDGAIPPVLLIDEIDRADVEFEAFLLEVLSDFQITIPELGTIRAKKLPYVVLTSNRTREIHDALKRRCLYHWIDYPSFEKEYAIVTAKVPEIQGFLVKQICSLVQRLRLMDFYKRPGVAETLDWASALVAMNRHALSKEAIDDTLGCIFKYKEDIERFHTEIASKTLDLDPILSPDATF